MYDQDSARKLLKEAGVFFETEGKFAQDLNMNDVWAWACSDGEEVKDEELPEVARLFYLYGWCGLLYWVSKKNDNMRSEFHDNNRAIDFVAHEEQLIKDFPGSSERAYKKLTYVIGE